MSLRVDLKEINLINGKAICFTAWEKAWVELRHRQYGIRSFRADVELSVSDVVFIENYFREDKDTILSFKEECVELYENYKRQVEIPIVEPLTIIIDKEVVEVFTPILVTVKGTRGTATIEIYVNDILVEKYVNQSVPFTTTYIPRWAGRYRYIVRHDQTGEIAVVHFTAEYKPPTPPEKPPEEKPTPPVEILPEIIEEKPPEGKPVGAGWIIPLVLLLLAVSE